MKKYYAGDKKSLDQIPMACKDAVAVLIMFDLTSRCTLNRLGSEILIIFFFMLSFMGIN